MQTRGGWGRIRCNGKNPEEFGVDPKGGVWKAGWKKKIPTQSNKKSVKALGMQRMRERKKRTHQGGGVKVDGGL